MATELIERDGGDLRLNFHPGQKQAWASEKRIVCILAGIQSGKTSFGALWLEREIQRCGPGDYLVATPTFPLLEAKLLPEFRRLFEQYLQYGRYYSTPIKRFVFSSEGDKRIHGTHDPYQPTMVRFGYAAEPESLASSTAKAVWADEVGMSEFPRESYNELKMRVAINRGRMLLMTRLYNYKWLKTEVYDQWKKAVSEGRDTDIDVIRFDSSTNPSFPKEEQEAARRSLPSHEYDMAYRAIYTRPAGMIYGSFRDEYEPVGHKVKPFSIPRDWIRYLGLDFGGVNTAGVFLAENPDNGLWFLYREYKAGGRTAAGHAQALTANEPHIHHCVGGSKSEGQWRQEFQAGGLSVHAPDIKEVEVGINRVYGAHAQDRLYVFDTCEGYLEQKLTYARELDEAGQPTEKIEDKETYHFLDAERYILGWLCGSGVAEWSDDPMAAVRW
jgi:hypothetical protein